MPEIPITVKAHDRRIWRIKRHPGYVDEKIVTIMASREGNTITFEQPKVGQVFSAEFAREVVTALDEAIAFVNQTAPSPYERYE